MNSKNRTAKTIKKFKEPNQTTNKTESEKFKNLVKTSSPWKLLKASGSRAECVPWDFEYGMSARRHKETKSRYDYINTYGNRHPYDLLFDLIYLEYFLYFIYIEHFDVSNISISTIIQISQIFQTFRIFQIFRISRISTILIKFRIFQKFRISRKFQISRIFQISHIYI